MRDFKFRFILIFGLLLIAVLLILGLLLQSINSRAESYNLLPASGSAKARITSNNAEIIISISRLAPQVDLADAYKYFERDLDKIKKVLAENGLDISRIEIGPVIIGGEEEEDMGREVVNNHLKRKVTIHGDAEKIIKVSQAIASLNSADVTFSVKSLEYYSSTYTDLYEPLLEEAYQDAEVQAAKKAASLGRHLGKLKRVVSGSETLLPVGSSSDSFPDQYMDTSSLEKDMVITVNLLFGYK